MAKYQYRDLSGKFPSCFYGPSLDQGFLSNQVPDDVRELWEAAHALARAANDYLVALIETDLTVIDPDTEKQIQDYLAVSDMLDRELPDGAQIAYIFSIPLQAAWKQKRIYAKARGEGKVP